jgi:hypothetical protein
MMSKQNIQNFFDLRFFYMHLQLRISPRIFEKIHNDPNGILRGFGETDSWKIMKSKNLVALSL